MIKRNIYKLCIKYSFHIFKIFDGSTFQSVRMKTRYKSHDKETLYAGTLNGSGVAIGRTLIAIMENYQQKDGSISIPKVLRPYMNNLEKISIN